MAPRRIRAFGAIPADAIGIALAALALRAYHLGGQSLWYDEGTSAQLARHAPGEILAAAAGDIHPPLYYLFLAAWMRLMGDSEWALRALSVFAGTVLVVGLWQVARRGFGRPAALAAGITAVASPFLVWYSQEARMYSLAAMWAVLLVLVIGRRGDAGGGQTRDRQGWPLVAAVLITTAALYTHYLGGLCALGLAALGPASSVGLSIRVPLRAGRLSVSWKSGLFDRRAMQSWLVMVFVPLLAFLPWLAYAWPAIRDWPATSAPFGVGFLLHESATALSYGEHLSAVARVLGPLLPWIAAFGVFATAWMCRQRSTSGLCPYRVPLATLIVWLALPVAILGLLAIRKPAWQPKQIIAAAPAFEIALGLGCWQAGRLMGRLLARGTRPTPPGSIAGSPASELRHGGRGFIRQAPILLAALFATVLLVPRLDSIGLTLADPSEQRDDYRGVAEQIAAEAGPSDAVVLNAPTQVEVFDYYNRGRLTTFPLPVGRPVDRAATQRELGALAARGGDAWAVLWATEQADPERIVETWLNERYFKVFERWQGRLRFARWAAPPPDGSMTSVLTTTVRFGDRLELHRLDVDPVRIRPGSVIRLRASWQVKPGDGPGEGAPAADYTVFCHLMDPLGNVVAQRDLPPAGGLSPTRTWQPGESHEDRIGFAVPGDLAPGDYSLRLGMYDPSRPDLPRLPVAGPGADADTRALVVGAVAVR